MLMTTSHPKGAKRLSFTSLDWDTQTGCMGYKIGYCNCGCEESVVLAMSDVMDILQAWGYAIRYPNKPIIQRIKNALIQKLGGKVE